jgi:predicted permease
LATAEMALALIVVAGAGLLVRSFVAVLSTDPGFRAEHVIKMFVPLTESHYPTSAAVGAFDHELLARICRLPGVTHCGAGSDLPLGGSDWNQVILPEGVAPSSQAKLPVASHTSIMGGYFNALGIVVKQGRALNEGDRGGAPYVVVVNEKMARTFWPHQNAVGKRLKFGGMGPDSPWHEVVGVMANARFDSMDKEPGPQFWETLDQVKQVHVAGIGRYLNFIARTSGDPKSIAAAFQIAVHSMDRTLPVSALRTMTDEVARSTEPRRFNTYLMGFFAAIALLLAAVGIYGVIGYSVNMKTQEIGIRMALGAARPDVFRMVIQEALIIAGAGIAAGLVGALALTRLISALLYQVKPWDPLTFAAVSVFLAAVAIAATCFPAFRATRVDPLVALRWE